MLQSIRLTHSYWRKIHYPIEKSNIFCSPTSPVFSYFSCADSLISYSGTETAGCWVDVYRGLCYTGNEPKIILYITYTYIIYTDVYYIWQINIINAHINMCVVSVCVYRVRETEETDKERQQESTGWYSANPREFSLPPKYLLLQCCSIF